MERKWLVLVIFLAAILLTGCSEENTVSMAEGLFRSEVDINSPSLCSIKVTEAKVVNQGTPPKAALILQGSVGSYCGQLEIKMSPINNNDEVHIIVVAEPPKEVPSSDDLDSSKPVFINMTLDSLPSGRYKLFVNGTRYATFSTP
ncbi:MAG: hypothetical protein AB9891_01890 [Anaerolineaceae bacterium]